jgi:hypothetical protein
MTFISALLLSFLIPVYPPEVKDWFRHPGERLKEGYEEVTTR